MKSINTKPQSEKRYQRYVFSRMDKGFILRTKYFCQEIKKMKKSLISKNAQETWTGASPKTSLKSPSTMHKGSQLVMTAWIHHSSAARSARRKKTRKKIKCGQGWGADWTSTPACGVVTSHGHHLGELLGCVCWHRPHVFRALKPLCPLHNQSHRRKPKNTPENTSYKSTLRKRTCLSPAERTNKLWPIHKKQKWVKECYVCMWQQRESAQPRHLAKDPRCEIAHDSWSCSEYAPNQVQLRFRVLCRENMMIFGEEGGDDRLGEGSCGVQQCFGFVVFVFLG